MGGLVTYDYDAAQTAADAASQGSDLMDYVSTGVPVYAVASRVGEYVAREYFDADDETAKNVGTVTGVTASVISTFTTGAS